MCSFTICIFWIVHEIKWIWLGKQKKHSHVWFKKIYNKNNEQSVNYKDLPLKQRSTTQTATNIIRHKLHVSIIVKVRINLQLKQNHHEHSIDAHLVPSGVRSVWLSLNRMTFDLSIDHKELPSIHLVWVDPFAWLVQCRKGRRFFHPQ